MLGRHSQADGIKCLFMGTKAEIIKILQIKVISVLAIGDNRIQRMTKMMIELSHQPQLCSGYYAVVTESTTLMISSVYLRNTGLRSAVRF